MTRALCRAGLVILWLLACLACARKAPQLPPGEAPAPFPEVARITFQGNTAFGSGALRKIMATKQRPVLPPWRRGGPYNPPTLEADLLRLKKLYFDAGYLEATVRRGAVREDREANTVSIEIRLDEGVRTTIDAVRLAGTLPPELPAAPQLLAALPLRPGRPLTKAAFDQSKTLLLARLQDASYARAQVIPETAVDRERHVATVTFTLEPGASTLFGHIDVTGEQQVSERAIRRKLLVREGQIYSAKRLTDSADDIFSLGMFQAVTPRARNPEEAGAPLDVDFEVRERKPHTVQVGAGFSTVEQFRLLVEWTHRNLFGGAQRFTLSGKASSIEQRFEAQLYLPYFLERRTSLSQTFFVRNEKEVAVDPSGFTNAVLLGDEAQPAFDLFSVGSETRLGRQFTRALNVATGLQLSRNEFSNVDTEALIDAEVSPEIAEDNLLFIHFTEVVWNTSDSLLNPTRGMLMRGRVEQANTAVVSDVSFVKLILEARHYQPIWRPFTLATRLKVGGVQPYGGSTEVPFNVRFFAGGPGSVRGFPLNSLGPKDANDSPIGGESVFEGSVELRFPIVGSFSGVVFADFGNVFSAPFTYALDDLRYAVGPGVRYNTPVGPLRLDVGFIVDRRTGEDFGRVEFSIGQAF
jgi:outer membrane protein assembly complex protein YaeT